MSGKLVTENNKPNRKVIATALGMIIFGWLNYLARTYLGMELPVGFAETIGGFLGGVVGYLMPPAKGDGVKEVST